LCAEAALLALRRRYPQVYNSKDKLMLDLSQINVERRDFEQAVQRLVPASQRSAMASGKPLSSVVTPLLDSLFHEIINTTQLLFPEGIATLKLKGAFEFHCIRLT
jgi:SpoVK/Ycf46/Vps4 family AAA+-type ATPase